jgi:cytosine/uracil/thiamine/allantoin permease
MSKYVLLACISAGIGFMFSIITEHFTESPHVHFTAGYFCGLIVGGVTVFAVKAFMDETKNREAKAK